MNRGGKNNGIYAAETILKQRTKDGKVWYLMKWKGYSPRFNTWEPEENVLDDRLLKAYRKRLAESKGKVKRKRSKHTEEENDKSEVDVDVEGPDSSNENTPTIDEEDSRLEDPSTSGEQSVSETPKKWRKRRKTNSGDSTSAQVETDKENAEVHEIPQPSPVEYSTDKIQEEPEVEPNNETLEDTHKEKEETVVKDMESSTSLTKMALATEPSCSSSSTNHDTTSTEKESIGITPVKTSKDVTPSHEERTSINKELPQKQTEKKSNILSKSSHFDFLANSIIITDVTTERGTITIKECSAYGDFFGPELGKS